MASCLRNLRVLVTPTSFGKSNPALRQELEEAVGEVIYSDLGRPLTSAEVRNLLPGVDGYIAGLDIIDDFALQRADRLKVISRYGVGTEKVDLISASHRSIVVTNTPQANSVSVAELAIALMLSLARSIPQYSAEVRAGNWPRSRGRTLEGKTIGLVGFGAIAKGVARRLAGWNCSIFACDPFPDRAAANELGVTITVFEEMIAKADFLSLHVPVLPETRGMMDAVTFSKVKKHSYLVNTARGELIDEDALAAALIAGHLAGAGLDAFQLEPPSPDHPLLQLPQVIATPHAGAHTDGAMEAMGRQSLNDCLAVLAGKQPRYPVNHLPEE